MGLTSFRNPPVPHICTCDCPFFRHRNVYICRFNGRHHHCSEVSCDRLVENSEHKACELTGMTYPLEHEATFEQGACSADYLRSRRVVQPSSKKRKRYRDKLEVKPPPDASPKSPQASPTEQRIERQLEESLHNERQDILRLVRGLVPSLGDKRHGELATIVHQAWHCVKQTRGFTRPVVGRATYTIAAHTLSMIVSMSQGGESGLILPQPDVAEAFGSLASQPANVVTTQLRATSRKADQMLRAMLYEYKADAPAVTRAPTERPSFCVQLD